MTLDLVLAPLGALVEAAGCDLTMRGYRRIYPGHPPEKGGGVSGWAGTRFRGLEQATRLEAALDRRGEDGARPKLAPHRFCPCGEVYMVLASA